MTHSLLYLNPASTQSPASIGKRVLYHLSLDRSVSYLSADVKKREYFFKVLSQPLTDVDSILFRREILADFWGLEGLFEELYELLSSMARLRESHRGAAKSNLHTSLKGNQTVSSAKNVLQMNALTLKRALLFVQALEKLLSSYKITSRGLLCLQSALREMTEKPQLVKLIEHCTRLDALGSTQMLDLRAILDTEGYLKSVSWIEHRHVRVTDPDLRQKSVLFFKKKAEEGHPCARLHPKNDGYYDTLAISALSELSTLLESLASDLLCRYCPLLEELTFYELALNELRLLRQKEIPITFPRFATAGTASFTALYDLYLLFSEGNCKKVVANDATLSQNGLAVFGQNGSGKTVFLRSLATAQILAQAGLPIPAKDAEIILFSSIVTLFSEAEKEHEKGNEAGRFEQEVRELAEMTDALRPHMLLLLNEPFQSTAYEEGAKGLYHLLRYYTNCDVTWVLVSHLQQLLPKLKQDGTALFTTADGFQILPYL